MSDPKNTDDVIDSRDVVARIEELEAIRDDGDVPNFAETDDGQELAALLSLQEEAEGYAADWHYGATLIRDSYFETYAKELADDLGCIPADAGWPCSCIDWEQAARELQMDYTSVEFDGVTYWVR